VKYIPNEGTCYKYNVPVYNTSCELHHDSYGYHGCCFLFEEYAEAEETIE